jgi:hypothetical protein
VACTTTSPNSEGERGSHVARGPPPHAVDMWDPVPHKQKPTKIARESVKWGGGVKCLI